MIKTTFFMFHSLDLNKINKKILHVLTQTRLEMIKTTFFMFHSLDLNKINKTILHVLTQTQSHAASNT